MVSVMLMTTCLVSLVMLVIWKTSIWIVAIFFIVFGGIEAVYFSSALYKFKEGGFLPLALSFFLMSAMGTWHYVHREKYLFELNNKVSSSYIQEVAINPEVRRIPGIGLLYSELVQGIPPIFPHFIRNVPSIHSVLIFVSIKRLPISHVSINERFLFRQVGPRENRMFRCVVRCGYKDILGDTKTFEPQLVEYLKMFVHHDFFINGGAEQTSPPLDDPTEGELEESRSKVPSRDSTRSIKSDNSNLATIEEEKQFIQRSMEEVVVYFLGEVQVVATKNSPLFKRIIIDHLYDFLRRNFRQGIEVLPVPRGRLLRVGMTYEI